MTLIALGRPELVETLDGVPPELVARYSNGESALWGLPGSNDLVAARCYRRTDQNGLNLVGHILALESPQRDDEGTVCLQRHRIVDDTTIRSESIRIGLSDCTRFVENPRSTSRIPNIDLVSSVIHAVRGGRKNSDPFASPQAPSGIILDRMITMSVGTRGPDETRIHPAVVAIARALRPLRLVTDTPPGQLPA